jgi:hypothetical protein
MATNKSADNKALQTANQTIITAFNKTDTIAAINRLADSKSVEDGAKSESGNASLEIVQLAESYGVAAHDQCNGDTSTVLKDWKSNMAIVAMELAKAGSPFAELAENAKGETTAKLTGTGQNVLSIAKGVVDFGVVTADCVTEEDGVSYRSVRKAVEGLRAERRDSLNPELAQLNEAKSAAREAFKELASVIFETGDTGLIDDLTRDLTDLRELAEIALSEQATANAAIEGQTDTAKILAAHDEALNMNTVEFMVANG